MGDRTRSAASDEPIQLFRGWQCTTRPHRWAAPLAVELSRLEGQAALDPTTDPPSPRRYAWVRACALAALPRALRGFERGGGRRGGAHDGALSTRASACLVRPTGPGDRSCAEAGSVRPPHRFISMHRSGERRTRREMDAQRCACGVSTSILWNRCTTLPLVFIHQRQRNTHLRADAIKGRYISARQPQRRSAHASSVQFPQAQPVWK